MKRGFLDLILCAAISTHASAQAQSGQAGPDGPVLLNFGTTGLLVMVHFLDERTGFAVGRSKKEDATLLLRTADGGQSWTPYQTGLQARLYDVHFPTARIGYAVGLKGSLLKTTDGGEHWRVIRSGKSQWIASVFFSDPLTGFIVGGEADGALLKMTVDGGEHWKNVLDRVPLARRTEQYRDVRFLDRKTGFVVGTGGTILKTVDGGRSWTAPASGVDTWLKAICFVDSKLGYIAGAQGVVLRTEDGGDLWRRLAFPSRDKLNDVNFVNKKLGYIVSMQGRLYRTDDGGRSWQTPFDTHGGGLSSLSFPSGRVGYASGERGVILKISPGDNGR
ncbi:MAG: hypothetical protein IID33_09085 [Planctomycetes bacterium]|nr:hypothetical protein [Planctomycetota bacterium]